MIEYVNENAEGAVLLTGFDNCIIGVVEEFGNGNRVLYSKEKIIQKLMEDINEEEAYEYFDYNILGGSFGEQNPVFLI